MECVLRWLDDIEGWFHAARVTLVRYRPVLVRRRGSRPAAVQPAAGTTAEPSRY